jgi:AAA family ATP:ADP antiporter
MMVSLLFWQFANSVIKTEEAKRFYSMFGMLGNLGLPAAGFVLGMTCNLIILCGKWFI